MGFKIQNFELDHDCEPFIILEAGINHCGNLNYALKMIDIAVSSGATAIKFQTFQIVLPFQIWIDHTIFCSVV